MKKLLSLAALSFTLLQSCTQDELDVAPKQLDTAPKVDMQSIVGEFKDLNGLLEYGHVSSLYLKSFDNDPATNLTTVYYQGNETKGLILPLVENFEVQQIEATIRGVYIKTNYYHEGNLITFFIKHDNSWVSLGGRVGEYLNRTDNGDIVFRDGSILRAETLMIDKIFDPNTTEILSVSGNLLYVRLTNTNTYRVINTVTNVYHDVERIGYSSATKMGALLDNEVAVIQNDSNMMMLNMRNGVTSVIEGIINPQDFKVGWNHMISVVSKNKASQLVQTLITFNFSGDVLTSYKEEEHLYWEDYNSNFGLGFILRYDYSKLLKKYVDNLVDYEVTYGRMGAYVYFTGTLNGKPVTGGYHPTMLGSVPYKLSDELFTSITLFPTERIYPRE